MHDSYRHTVYSVTGPVEARDPYDEWGFTDTYITPYLSRPGLSGLDIEQPGVVQPEEKLWEEAFRASEISDDAQVHLNGLYEEISALRRSSSYMDKTKADELENDYWSNHEKLQDLKELEKYLLEVLAGFEKGELTREELAKLLPSDQEEATISKRRQAIQRAHVNNSARSLTAMELFMYGFGYSGYNDTQAPAGTDPRRVATGRNLARLVAKGTGISALDAPSRFFEVTADTHGGKSRRPSKGATHYVSTSGKRIRKR